MIPQHRPPEHAAKTSGLYFAWFPRLFIGHDVSSYALQNR
jgi:hypothetical protein